MAKMRCSGFGIHIGSLFYRCIFTQMTLLCCRVAVMVFRNCQIYGEEWATNCGYST